jgi:hypothetical protein
VSLCLAAAGLAVEIAASAFTLSWTHTVEKIVWQEDWRVEAGRLVLDEARVKGSGAGMEPPQGAALRGGFYVWRPDVPARPELVLRRAAEAGDWRLCAAGRCAALGEWLGSGADPVRIFWAQAGSCERPADGLQQ